MSRSIALRAVVAALLLSGVPALGAAQSTLDPAVAAADARRVAGDTVGLVAEYERALRRLESASGNNARSIEQALRGLSILHFRQRNTAAALAYQERLAPLMDSLAGPQSLATAQEWHNLGVLRSMGGRQDDAIVAADRALEVRLRELPPGDALTKTTQRQLATSLRDRAQRAATAGALVNAWNDYDRAMQLSEAADGPDAEPTLQSLLGLIQLFDAIGKSSDSQVLMAVGPQRAVAVGERALDVLQREFGANDPRVRRIAADLEVMRTGATAMSIDPRATRDAAARAAAAAEDAYGPDARETAQALMRLGVAQGDLREFAAARATLERALAIRTRTDGASSEPVAEVQRRIGELLRNERRMPEARAQLERALATAEGALGNDAPGLAPFLKSLADLMGDLGDQQQQRAFVARADRVERATAASAGSPEAALRNVLRASDLQARGDRAGARRLREDALRSLEPQFGPSHIVVATVQFALARDLIALEDYAGAERLVRRGMETAGNTFGVESPEFAVALTMLANVASARKDYPEAERILRQVVALNDRTIGPGHPQGFARRFDLADVMLTQRKFDEGGRYVLESAAHVDRYAREILPTLSVAEQQAFLETTLPYATAFLMMSAHSAPDLVPAIYDRLAGWKGLLLRGIDRQAAVARLADDPRARQDVQRVGVVRGELASLVQNVATMEPPAYRQQLERLTTEKERLERRLAELVPETPDAWQSSAALSAQLPARTAFVDIFRHSAGEQARYQAIVTVAGQRPISVDLGPAARIEQRVAAWRTAVTGDRFAIDEFWALVSATIDPIARALPEKLAFIWISPDAQLSRVPWATLAAYNDRTKEAQSAQVPSARALVSLLAAPALADGGDVVLVGDVDFDAGPRAAQRPSTRWTPLPGTGTEVRAIYEIASGKKVPTRRVAGPTATPSAVTQALVGARVAHLATHGFFFGESEAVYNSRGVVGVAPVGLNAAPASRNPLAESGLALAGANVNAAGNLTAEQILGLDLRRLKLVVLSACETGRGAEVTGQGVLGLQASLLAAGTRGMLMSLWKVPDESTAFLMERFYTYYLDGYAAPVALRQAQSDVLGREEFRNPVHWAGWVFVGGRDG